jgi:protocatechuate 3,4-dioxygenase beta subunit
VRESQEGVDLVLDTQVIDVDTCEPVPNVHIEIWHCNSTGVYSGIVASGNGDSSDASNINATFLRGVQETDSDGVAQFETLFPGHYTGRATHIHVMVHVNGTVLSNGTWSGAVAAHVGQMFFDQDLIFQVEAVTPYSTNTQTLTTNADDSIMSSESENNVDPVMEYTLLGDSVEDGLFAWLAFGMNTTYADYITPAATLYASGGVENSKGAGGGPGGNNTGPGGNSTASGGASFSGCAMPATSTAA